MASRVKNIRIMIQPVLLAYVDKNETVPELMMPLDTMLRPKAVTEGVKKEISPPVVNISMKPPKRVRMITLRGLLINIHTTVKAKIIGNRKAPMPNKKTNNPAIWAPTSPNTLCMFGGMVKKLFPTQGSAL